MAEYTRGSHAARDIKYHTVWITKYRYEILTKRIAERLRELLIRGRESRGITIVEGSAGKEHVHILKSCPAHIAPAKAAEYLKGRSSRLIQEEFPELKKRYWGSAFEGGRIFLRDGRRGNGIDDRRIYQESN